MPFIKLTNIDGTVVRINMDMAESYALASDPQKGTKIFSPTDEAKNRCYWRVKETPEAIDRLLQLARNPNAAPQYDPAMSPSMDVRDAKVHSRINIRSEFPQAEKEWIQDVFGSNSQARTFTGTNYIVTVNDAMEIARIISDRTLRDIERTFRP